MLSFFSVHGVSLLDLRAEGSLQQTQATVTGSGYSGIQLCFAAARNAMTYLSNSQDASPSKACVGLQQHTAVASRWQQCSSMPA